MAAGLAYIGLYGASAAGPVTLRLANDPRAVALWYQRHGQPRMRLLQVVALNGADPFRVMSAFTKKPYSGVRLQKPLSEVAALLQVVVGAAPRAGAVTVPDSVAVERVPEAPRPLKRQAALRPWYAAVYGARHDGPVRIVLTQDPRKAARTVQIDNKDYRLLAVEPLHHRQIEPIRVWLDAFFKSQRGHGEAISISVERASTVIRDAIKAADTLPAALAF